MLPSFPPTQPMLPRIELPSELVIAPWPRPPYACDDSPQARAAGVRASRIETLAGAPIGGELVGFDIDAQALRFRVSPDGEPLELPFARFRRLTLSAPWRLDAAARHAPHERLSTATHERSWQATLFDGSTMTGHTLGFVQRPEGWYLYEPIDDGDAVRPLFVPAAACRSMQFGTSSAERAAARWIGSREELQLALEAQRRAPLRSVGEALLELGFVTRAELERALHDASLDPALPLGERLVAAGVLDRADLNTALAYKMGTPMVDLTRFPIEPGAAGRLPLATLREHRALPLMRDGQRLVVAVDELGRVAKLQALAAPAGLQVVPVLAPTGRLSMALRGLPQHVGDDVWGDNVRLH
jgi:hypothetical protein